MEVILINKNGKVDISGIISSATISGEYRSCSRSLNFGFIKSSIDKNTHTVGINLGNNIQIIEDGKLLFHGIIWDKGKSSDENEINFLARDFGIYLNKNKGSYKFKNITPEAITKKVCGDFGIQIGEIASTGVKISRKYLGVSLYDIIMSSYTIANDKKYMCIFEDNKLNVIEKAVIKAKDLDISNLLSSNVSESLNDMINRVNIYNSKDEFIKKVENTEDITSYGLMAEYLKVTDSKENYQLKSKKMLEGVSRKIVVSNFGDTSYITGKALSYEDPYQGIKGLFYIDSDEHNWKNGIYTNKMTLNFKNLMDEKEGGSAG